MLTALVAIATAADTAAGQPRSPIVLNCDGNGTTVVKEVGDSSFQVQQLWTDNSVNGIQTFSDGTFAFVNCTPTLRTLANIELSCSIFDQALGRWGESPVTTTVPVDFLDGDNPNPFNALTGWTGEYLTIFEVGEDGYTFRLRFSEAFLTEDGVPVLLGATSPESRTFMLRNVDAPGGTTSRTNISVGMQFDDLCVDFDLNPTVPGETLAGTFGAREREADGSCGEVVVSRAPAAFVPNGFTGVTGSSCRYRVVSPGGCIGVRDGVTYAGLAAGSTVCTQCFGTCTGIAPGVGILLTLAPTTESGPYVICRDPVLEPIALECSTDCSDGALAIVTLTGNRASAARAAFAAAGRRD